MGFNSTLNGIGNDLKSNIDNLSRDFQNQINNQQNSAIKDSGDYPWRSTATGVNKFFPYVVIKPDRWDQLFPYRLLVIDSFNGNQIVNGTSNSTIKVTKDNGRTTLQFEPLGNQWVFTLPITPDQLTIADDFAINTTATLRGVLEEHGGLKFKMIQAGGTMGVWPFRESVSTPPGSPSPIQSVFGGTLESASAALSQVARTINTATSNFPVQKPASKRPETSNAGVRSTGYYHAMALQQFLEQYALAKTKPENAGWRLVFDIPKQNQSFVVTPLPFIWKQTVQKTLEVLYELKFKAWRRIDLQQKVVTNTPSIQPLSPGILQRVLNTISEARRALSASIDLIGAVRSDIERPLDVLRQSSLFVKDLAGVVVSVADLPFQIQRDYASSIKTSLNILKDSISTSSSDPSVRKALTLIAASTVAVEGLSLGAVAGGQLGKPTTQNQSIDPANNVFRQPERNFALMDEVPIYNLSLNDAQQSNIDQVIDNARETTVDDLKQYRAVIQDLALQFSNAFGSGDAFYNQVYNRPPPTERVQPLTLDEYDLLTKLYEVMQSYDILTATTEVDDLNKQTNMEYVAGLADLSGMEFELPNSKILVPVPFGLTIEAIAARYLGDPLRWIEIATLNNLRDPYIDENGFQLTLLSNANGRQITVSNIENLYIGQRVLLRSSTQVQTARRILGIDRLSDTSFLLSLDGVADLDNFTIADGAYLQAYLPGTVNSQQKIFVPSEYPVPDDPNILVPSSTSMVDLVGLSKVDWLLTDNGDVAVNNYGDFRLSAGITNLIQALKIKIGTPKGSVLLHPDFGLGIRAGIMNSEIDVQDIFNSINTLISEDPRFSGLSGLQISINGPVLSISMGVALAGQQGVYPITFEMPV